ncbi:brain protein I3-like [Vanessa atalanta]|uniref:brain protein I3-like n=1 Tax=Vanessa cardui TaxID=171605 RepID=UPI001F148B75|nr:brain protein I3-like [Vanessa cardui]XP_047534930.1 brain protein I3-like [Vanessa atalanta]
MEKQAYTEQPPPYSATVPPPPGPQAYPHPQPQPQPQPTQGAFPPPPPGYTPYGTTPQANAYLPNYGATNIIIPPAIIAVGACPACRVGILEDDFTCLGILCAILFFPLGILCCLALKNRRCSNCGAMFG